jgi:hypothetical protein
MAGKENIIQDGFAYTLDRMGIQVGKRYEAIVTTNGPHVNAAAMGVRRVGENFNLKIFELSNTYDNIVKYKDEPGTTRFGINFIDSSQMDLLCYSALRGWGSPIPEFPEEYYENGRETPVLKDAHACIICEPVEDRIEDIKDGYGQAKRMNLTARIIEIIINDTDDFEPISRNRGEPLLDALVLATKFKIAKGSMKDKCRNRVEELLEQAGAPSDVGHTLTMEALKEYFGILD